MSLNDVRDGSIVALDLIAHWCDERASRIARSNKSRGSTMTRDDGLIDAYRATAAEARVRIRRLQEGKAKDGGDVL